MANIKCCQSFPFLPPQNLEFEIKGYMWVLTDHGFEKGEGFSPCDITQCHEGFVLELEKGSVLSTEPFSGGDDSFDHTSLYRNKIKGKDGDDLMTL